MYRWVGATVASYSWRRLRVHGSEGTKPTKHGSEGTRAQYSAFSAIKIALPIWGQLCVSVAICHVPDLCALLSSWMWLKGFGRQSCALGVRSKICTGGLARLWHPILGAADRVHGSEGVEPTKHGSQGMKPTKHKA